MKHEVLIYYSTVLVSVYAFKHFFQATSRMGYISRSCYFSVLLWLENILFFKAVQFLCTVFLWSHYHNSFIAEIKLSWLWMWQTHAARELCY